MLGNLDACSIAFNGLYSEVSIYKTAGMKKQKPSVSDRAGGACKYMQLLSRICIHDSHSPQEGGRVNMKEEKKV